MEPAWLNSRRANPANGSSASTTTSRSSRAAITEPSRARRSRLRAMAHVEGRRRGKAVMLKPAQSAFIVRVPEAESRVGALRERFDASVKLGVPAHITVLVPFMSPERISAEVLAEAQAALNEVPAFPFALTSVARFPATAYLAPEPAQS